MMTKTFALFTFVVGLGLAVEINLKEQFLKADNEIKATDLAKMMAGATSDRNYLKKFTKE